MGSLQEEGKGGVHHRFLEEEFPTSVGCIVISIYVTLIMHVDIRNAEV